MMTRSQADLFTNVIYIPSIVSVWEYFDVYLWIFRHQNTLKPLKAQELVASCPECGKSTLNKLKKRRVSPAYPSYYTCSSCHGSIQSADLKLLHTF